MNFSAALKTVLKTTALAACAYSASSFATDSVVPASAASTKDPATPQFVAEEKWERAGYNNDEVVYSVYITNHDTRILSCTTKIQGFYLSNGKKSSIADQQLSTVFPDQQVQAGIWLDMDEKSGAKYQVNCKPK